MRHLRLVTERDWTDITNDVADFVRNFGSGIVNIFSLHTTMGIVIFEKEALLLNDVNNKLDEFAPKDAKYGHDNIGIRDVPRDERRNGFAHLRSLLFGTEVSVPVQDGFLLLGDWQRIFAVELDGRRDRDIILTFTKEEGC